MVEETMVEETMATVVEAVQGLSAEEIEGLINASTNAVSFGDPAMVAVFLAMRASAL